MTGSDHARTASAVSQETYFEFRGQGQGLCPWLALVSLCAAVKTGTATSLRAQVFLEAS